MGESAQRLPKPPEGGAITLGDDGVYRWVGVTDLWHNPTTLYLILKVICISCVPVLALMLFLLGGDGPSSSTLLFLGIGIAIIAGVLLLAVGCYAIYALYMGGTSSAEYLMDETGVLYVPSDKHATAIRATGAAAAIAGAVSGNYGNTVAGIAVGMNAGTAFSDFKAVRKVKGIRKHGVIKVSQLTLYNQVYVRDADYAFVLDFMRAHCPKAKVVES